MIAAILLCAISKIFLKKGEGGIPVLTFWKKGYAINTG
jgi:hypothetical protein